MPFHPHLIGGGFVEFARSKKGDAPLFYSRERQRKKDRSRDQKRRPERAAPA